MVERAVVFSGGRRGGDAGDVDLYAARRVARHQAGSGRAVGGRVLGDVYRGAGRGGAWLRTGWESIAW